MAARFSSARRGFTLAIVAFACLTAATRSSAGVIGATGPTGSQAFANLGTISAGPTTNISDAATFTINDFISTRNSFGYFTGLPRQTFSVVTFTLSAPTSLQFGNAYFGTFASTKITELSNDPAVGARSFRIEGTFTKGTFNAALVPNPALADLTISFNQVAGTGTPISANATLGFPTQPVPEPTTLGLAAAAIGTALAARARRRLSRVRP